MLLEPLRLPFDVSLRLPGSKSHANRAIVAACLAAGRSTVRDATPSDDVAALADNLQRMGFRLDWVDRTDGLLQIDGGLPERAPQAGPVELDCGLGGTTLRFLCAVAALLPGDWILTGSARMRERPVADLVRALRALGVEAEAADGRPPVRIRGGLRRGGQVALDASRSSQFLSALLLIGPVLDGGLRIDLTGPPTSPTYVELTTRVLETFGAEVRVEGLRYTVPGTGLRTIGDLRIEGDWSAAGAWLALAELTRSRFRGTNLAADSAQGDRLLPLQLELLRRPGAVELDLTDTPDQAMNLAVVAAFRPGRTRLTGAANLRGKECDRLAVTAAELQRAGVDCRETADGLEIDGPARLRPALLRCHGDHRMAMAFAVLGSLAGGIGIDDPACVSKSYPQFFRDLRAARHSPRCVALIGMRGAGKTSLGRALAERLGADFADSDAAFERERGGIADFVARSGWDAFRALESGILADLLAPGRVVALGGGALERPGNLDLCRERALLVWVREEPATLVERLGREPRPALTGLPPAEEVAALCARREPVFASVADLSLEPGTSVAERVRCVEDWLRGRLPSAGPAA
jgi:3-phosphoshikimate 1-carboxyvinyltransferase